MGIIVLVSLAGCAGTVDRATDATDSADRGPAGRTVQCDDGRLPADAPLDGVVPSPPDGWTEVDELPGDAVLQTKLGPIEYDPSPEEDPGGGPDGVAIESPSSERPAPIEHLSRYYRSSDGDYYIVGVQRWDSHEEAIVAAEASAVLVHAAVDGRTSVYAAGNGSLTVLSLITSVPCVSEEDLVEGNVSRAITVSVNGSAFNGSMDDVSSVDITDRASASISNVDHEVRTDSLGTFVEVTVEGTFENTSLHVSVGESGGLISEDDLADGTGSVDVRLSAPPSGTVTYPLVVSATSRWADTTRSEEITVEGAEFEVGNLRIQSEKYDFMDEYRITRLRFDIRNTGGVGATVDTATVVVNGHEMTVFVHEVVEGGSTLTIDSEEYPMLPPDLHEGENTVELRVIVDGEVVAAHSETVVP